MKKDTITKYLTETLTRSKEFEKKVHKIYEEGLCLINFLDDQYSIIHNLLRCFLTEEGVDYIYWWLESEKPDKIIYYKDSTTLNLNNVDDIVKYVVENNLLGD